MAKRTAAPVTGRPSKGPRDAIGTRLPRAHSEQLRAVAADLGWYNSDATAELIRVGLRHLGELAAPARGSETYLARVPQADGQTVRTIAADLDWSYSDVVAALIAVGLGHLDELPRKGAPAVNSAQQELPLTKAS